MIATSFLNTEGRHTLSALSVFPNWSWDSQDGKEMESSLQLCSWLIFHDFFLFLSNVSLFYTGGRVQAVPYLNCCRRPPGNARTLFFTKRMPNFRFPRWNSPRVVCFWDQAAYRTIVFFLCLFLFSLFLFQSQMEIEILFYLFLGWNLFVGSLGSGMIAGGVLIDHCHGCFTDAAYMYLKVHMASHRAFQPINTQLQVILQVFYFLTSLDG